jgi:hypothetical protein
MPTVRAVARSWLSAWVADWATNDPLVDLGCLPDQRIGRQASEVLNVRAWAQPAAPACSFSVLVGAAGPGQICKR